MWKYVPLFVALLVCECDLYNGTRIEDLRVMWISNYSTISGVNITLKHDYGDSTGTPFTYYLCESPAPDTSVDTSLVTHKDRAYWWSIESVADSFPFAMHGHVDMSRSRSVDIHCKCEDNTWQWEVIWNP